jgi:hypothetical protein
MTNPGDVAGPDYAKAIAGESYDWYRRAATSARRSYRLSEILFLVLSTAIPMSAVLSPKNATVPAVFGAVLVILAGLRSVYHWYENYVRFSCAREAVNAELRLYLTSSEPYDDVSTKDQVLVAAVTRIEQQEMGQWVRVVSPPRRAAGSLEE